MVDGLKALQQRSVYNPKQGNGPTAVLKYPYLGGSPSLSYKKGLDCHLHYTRLEIYRLLRKERADRVTDCGESGATLMSGRAVVSSKEYTNKTVPAAEVHKEQNIRT